MQNKKNETSKLHVVSATEAPRLLQLMDSEISRRLEPVSEVRELAELMMEFLKSLRRPA